MESPTVKYEMLDDNMAYIQIVEFDDVTIDQFTDALGYRERFRYEGTDPGSAGQPRRKPGCSGAVSRESSLPEGMIVYTEDKAGKRTEYTCDGKNSVSKYRW